MRVIDLWMEAMSSGGGYVLSKMKMIVFAFEPLWVAETYVCRLSMVSTYLVGLPSWALPERQHEPWRISVAV